MEADGRDVRGTEEMKHELQRKLAELAILNGQYAAENLLLKEKVARGDKALGAVRKQRDMLAFRVDDACKAASTKQMDVCTEMTKDHQATREASEREPSDVPEVAARQSDDLRSQRTAALEEVKSRNGESRDVPKGAASQLRALMSQRTAALDEVESRNGDIVMQFATLRISNESEPKAKEDRQNGKPDALAGEAEEVERRNKYLRALADSQMQKCCKCAEAGKEWRGGLLGSRRPGKSATYEWEEHPSFCREFKLLLGKFRVKRICTDVHELVRQKNLLFPTADLPVWLSESLIVKDRNDKPLLYFLKHALQRPFRNRDPTLEGLEALEELVEVYPPNRPASANGRFKGQAIPLGSGVHHLAFWHGTGHKHVPGVLSQHIIGSGKKLNWIVEFINKFTPVTQAIGALFECIDSDMYETYKAMFDAFAPGAASYMHSTSQNCFLGMAINTQLAPGPYRDTNDPVDGWVVNVAFGDFEGGRLEVPQLGLQFVLQPGDVVFMRSAVLQHSISRITSSSRFGVVFFTHEANFAENLRKSRISTE